MVVVSTAWQELLTDAGSWQQLVQYVLPCYFESVLVSWGKWAPFLFVVLYTARPLFFMPSGVFALTAGLVFGTLWGTVYTIIGAAGGSCLAFLLARQLGRDWVGRRLRGRLGVIDRVTDDNGFKVILLLRLVPVLPFDVVSYGAGLTNIPFLSYLAATVLGITPLTVVFVYLGQSLTQLTMSDILLAGVLVAATLGLPILLRQVLRRI